MPGNNGEDRSIHQRISQVLRDCGAQPRAFAAVESAVEVDRLEFQLARARAELRAVQERVEELTLALEAAQKASAQT